MGFSKRVQREDHATAHQPEVSGIERHVDRNQQGEASIEHAGRQYFERGLALAFAPNRVNDVEPLAPFRAHFRHDLGGILQVGVQYGDGLAARIVEPGGDRSWMSEVSRQGDDAIARLARRQLAEKLERTVLRSVVDEDDLAWQTQRGEERLQSSVELGDDVFFVVNRQNKAQRRRLEPRRWVLRGAVLDGLGHPWVTVAKKTTPRLLRPRYPELKRARRSPILVACSRALSLPQARA